MRILFEVGRKERSYSGFELGHVLFDGPLAAVSSRDCLPPQPMMVFTSAASLADVVRKTTLGKAVKHFEWIGDDSSFRVSFSKTTGGRILVQAMKKSVAVVVLPELFEAVNSAVSTLIAGDGELLDRSSAAWTDLQSAHGALMHTMRQLGY